MKRATLIASLVGALLSLGCAYRAHAYPQPSPYPKYWQLDFDHALPKRIVVQAPGDSTPVAYWYMTFTVTNNTNDDQQFFPVFEMLTEDGPPIASDSKIPPAVFDKIKEVEGIKLLQHLRDVAGKLRIGPSQAKDSVAIWAEPKARIGSFSLFVSGLSGETLFLKKDANGVFQPMDKDDHPTDNDGHITMVKTLQLDYQVPGDEHAIDLKAIAKGETWIMR